ncbi:putative Chloroperoxidase [Seiridium unicorne]|uniref:Chloroperoxidase n=1 Tax=Seiridium unicorne TaxID=138068 RepID=A0ABR2UVW9_9PEZI
MRSNILVYLALSGLVAAGSKNADPAGHQWQAAAPGDSRAPCPMLNAMANHGWLPRDGKNIDLPTVQSAFESAMNFAPDVFVTITTAALAVSTTGNSSTFNLQDTAHHNAIEHDGSLSRNDIFFGDNLHFNPLIWAATAARYGIRIPFSSSVITVETAAKARAARVKDAKTVNPAFNLTSAGLSGSYGESSVLLTALWDESAGGAPKDWVRVLFEEERIAYAEGFAKPASQHTLTDLGNMVAAIEAVQV